VTALIIIVVIIVVALAAAALVIRQKNQQANIARADQLRQQAASQAQATIAPAQERAAEAEAEAEEARARAEQAEREAHEARLEAQQVEATHESQVRAADRLDPRVDHKADDYAPQVPGTVDQGPTPPAEVNAEPEPAPQAEAETTERPPLLPRRTPGSNDMPGKPIEKTDGGGGWFTKSTDQDSSKS
jgi:FtsZ-interacting cell division protein ZipA